MEKRTKRIEELIRQFHQVNNRGKPSAIDLGECEAICRGYIRIGPKKQVEGRLSLSGQTEQIEDFCKTNNYKLAKIYVDEELSTIGASYDAMVRDLLPGEFVVISSLCRLGCNAAQVILQAENLKKKGGNLRILNMNIDLNSDIGSTLLEFVSIMNSHNKNLD